MMIQAMYFLYPQTGSLEMAIGFAELVAS